MPSQHVPGKGSLQTLRTKVETGHMRSAKKGCLGRKLTAEELEACKRELAELEAKRKEGMEHRKKVAKETLQNTRDLKQGQAELKQGQGEIKDGVGRIEQKLDRILGAEGSSQHHRELAKQATKREREKAKEELKRQREDSKRQREDDKIRQLLSVGLSIDCVDRFVDGVLIRGGVLSPQCFEVDDLGAAFELCGLDCRLAALKGSMALVQVMQWEGRTFPESELKSLGLEKMEAQPRNGSAGMEIVYEESKGLMYNKPIVKTGAERWIRVTERYFLVRLLMPASCVFEQLAAGEPSPKRRRTEEAAEPAAQPAATEPAEAAPAEAAPAEQPPPAPPAPKPPSPEPLSAANEQLPEILVHGVRCSHLVADYYIVKEAFPELLEIVLCIESTSPPLGTFYGMQLKPENRSQVPSTCAQLRLKLSFEQPAAEPAPQHFSEKKPGDSEDSSTRAETEPAELPAIQDAEPADEEPAQTVRIFGEQGFDVEIKDGCLGRVLGDLYHAGKVLEGLCFEVTLHLFKDSRKLGTPQIVENVVLNMVEDRRSGKAFDVNGTIAKVTRVTMLLDIGATRLNGFWGMWMGDGQREIISDFEAFLMADPAPYGIEYVDIVEGGRRAPEPGARTPLRHVIRKQRPDGQSAAQKVFECSVGPLPPNPSRDATPQPRLRHGVPALREALPPGVPAPGSHCAAVHEGRREHACPHCQKRFGFASGLREHVRLAHENVRPHGCGLCGRSFHKAADLRAHAAIHERRGFVYRSGREACVERLLRREELPFRAQLRVDFTDGSSHGGHALLDFAVERDWGLIALEVDEGQHASREPADECRRMVEIFRSKSRPPGKLRFLRYNPDCGLHVVERHGRLLEALAEPPPAGDLEILYLYYDLPAPGAELPSVCLRADYLEELRAVARAY
ncbi:ZNF358 [Symbiodinium sp. CCMP2592]|nr:ZNF358 [Symbiodinium sp. CCMP2592]